MGDPAMVDGYSVRSRRRQFLVQPLAIGLACGVLVLTAGTALAGQHQEGSAEGLEGAWIETITSTDGSFPPFQTFQTYGAGGGLVGTASIDMTPGLKSSTTHGAWKQVEGRQFRWTGHAFSFNDAGIPNGTYNIKERLTLTAGGNAYTGTGTFEVVNGAGAFPLTPYKVTGVRIKP